MMIGNYLRDRRGNFAIMFALAAVPLFLGIGAYIDYARQSSAYSHLQTLADAASLRLASMRTTDTVTLKAAAQEVVDANTDPNTVQSVKITKLALSGQRITVALEGGIDTTFMRFANTQWAGVQAAATAERGVNGNVEVALVLDNTFSMSGADGYGGTKMSALKSAASDLVKKVLADPKGQVKVAVVPYADYVNVGTDKRGASWLSIPAESTIPGTCTTYTYRDVCESWNPTFACTRVVDNIEVPGTCGGGCANWIKETVPPYQYCTGDTQIKWFGCVGSRMPLDWRINDERPSIPYPGYVNWVQLCPTPITELTSTQNTVLSAIEAMKTSGPYYEPLTYIPSGLIWGQNVLSPRPPFNEGKDYDPTNIAPRKVVVLMTDGDNTLHFVNSDGTHIAFDGGQEATQRKATDDDSEAICTYMKKNKIEVFSVAFMVSDAQAKGLLERCATDPSHYYDASDSKKLIDSFEKIADSLAMVRLVK